MNKELFANFFDVVVTDVIVTIEPKGENGRC